MSGSIALLILASGLVYFLYVIRTDNSETLTYDGKTYYATAYITPNLSGDGKDTKIFGGATYVGDYKNKKLDLKTKSINELYLNESADQSLVLQASVLQLKNDKLYLCFSGSMGRIGYWQVPDSLLARLR